MNIEKWNAKTAAYLDELLTDQTEENPVIYFNSDDGVLFADRGGLWARFLPEHQVLSASPKHSSSYLKKVFDEAVNQSVLADVETGEANGKKCRKLTHGDTTVYVYEKLLRDFPKNALFYVSGETKPVLVCLEDFGSFHAVALVMPFRIMSSPFVSC